MSALVIDASIAVKWVIEEGGTADALALRRPEIRLIAPDLLVSECANVLWKKVQRKEISREEAFIAARLLQGADIELLPTRSVLEPAVRFAIELDHAAYDCIYIALAIDNGCQFVTADERLVKKLLASSGDLLRAPVVNLAQAAADARAANTGRSR